MNPIERMQRRFGLSLYDVFIVAYSFDEHLRRQTPDYQTAQLAQSNYENHGIIPEHLKNVLRAINLDVVIASTIADILENEM